MAEPTEIASSFPGMVRVVPHRASRPTARQWALHAGLFLVTAITTTITGIVWTGGQLESASASTAGSSGDSPGSLLLLPWYYANGVISIAWQALTHPALLALGLKFSFSLLAILTAHESG